jgi:amidase
MHLSEYARYDAIGLAELVRDGEITPADLVACACRAIDAVNPRVNAVIGRLDPAEQLASAPQQGAFYGVPFLIKDLIISAKGVHCDMGSRLVHGAYVAAADSALMSRFRNSGLVTLGRTNAPEFGFNATTEPVVYGATRNPWNLAHSAGGSSGGSAAAVAAGMVPAAHANDGGGSTRIPAGNCGLVGLKPSRGRVSFAPDYADPLHGMGVELAVSRTVRDSAALLDAVAGPAVGDPFIIEQPKQRYAQAIEHPPGQLRIAFSATPDALGGPPDAECVRALETVAKRCSELGHSVEVAHPEYDAESFHRANKIFWGSFTAAGVDGVAQLLNRKPSPENLEAGIWAFYQYGLSLRALDLEMAAALRNATCRKVGLFYEKFDVLLTLTTSAPAPKLGVLNCNDSTLTADTWYRHLFRYVSHTALYNMTGQPAISLPLAQTEAGMPIGIQAVGRFGTEDVLLALAAQLETAMPWASRLPPVHVSRV